MFQAGEPVTSCDQFAFFFRCKTKGEILREPVRIPFDGLIQCLRRDAVHFSKVRVDHHAMAPDGENPLGNVVHNEPISNYCAKSNLSEI